MDRESTVIFFHKSGEVYDAFSRGVILQWHEANAHLERGVLAEFDHKLDPENSPLDPHLFKRALAGYEQVALGLETLDRKLAELAAIQERAEPVELYEKTLTGILAEMQSLERLSRGGVRYADIAGGEGKSKPIEGTSGILAAQREDLAVLRKTLDEVLVGLRDAIPLAEKGEFAQVMLSGRNAFGDKMPQFTDMISAFERLYTRTCMATIATTMQVYPKGFEWLTAAKHR